MKRLIGFIAAATMAMSGVAYAQSLPIGPAAGFTSGDEVEYVGFVPFEVGSSTGISIQGKYMYLTSWKNISIYDISDPTAPQRLSQVPIGFWFENEQVSVSPDGRYLYFAESLPGNTLHIWDVEDKSAPAEVATVEGAGDHTTSCILKCKYLYGSDGSIVDVRDPLNAKLLASNGEAGKRWTELATGQNFSNHDVLEVKPGFILTAPISGPFHYIDVRNPVKPKVVALGIKEAEEGWLFHSARWPNNATDDFILMQGELNAQTRCDEVNGPFQTYDARNWQKTKTFTLIDTYRVLNGTYQDGSPAVNGLGCSAHWFENHPTFKDGGLVGMGYYEHGTRFFSVDGKGKITEEGWFIPNGGSTSGFWWASTKKNERIGYAVDYTRGIDILKWNGKF